MYTNVHSSFFCDSQNLKNNLDVHPIGNRINKLWCSHTMEHYSALKRNVQCMHTKCVSLQVIKAEWKQPGQGANTELFHIYIWDQMQAKLQWQQADQQVPGNGAGHREGFKKVQSRKLLEVVDFFIFSIGGDSLEIICIYMYVYINCTL